MAMSTGVLVGVMGMLVYALKFRRQASKARRYTEKMEKDLENLRALPIRDDV